VAPLTIPANLANEIAAAGDDERHAWLAGLQDTITALSHRWSLTVGEPYCPGGCCAWVAPARVDGACASTDSSGAGDPGSPATEFVLKVGWSHDESLDEPAGLRAWDGAGSVRLIAEQQFGHTSALLLERCVPGTSLAESTVEPDQDEIVAGLLQRLWIEPEGDDPFRPLEAMCDRWADEFEASLERAPGAIDLGLARAGTDLFRALPRAGARHVLLCTDLHAENILAAQREPWLAIDPKPYVGDPAYDVLQHMLNCPDRLLADPHGLARRMADLCELDADRVTAWLLARSVVESIGDPTLTAVAGRLATGARS
jgi:streptomycin 6-kinase